MLMPVSGGQGDSVGTLKAIVRQGHCRSPHHRSDGLYAPTSRLRAQSSPPTVGEALDQYERALLNRRTLAPSSRQQSIYYARKACAFMNALALPIASLDVRTVRLLAETAPGSDAQRRHIYGALNRFPDVVPHRQGLVSRNVCDALDRQDRPKPARARDPVPSLKTLRAIRVAAER